MSDFSQIVLPYFTGNFKIFAFSSNKSALHVQELKYNNSYEMVLTCTFRCTYEKIINCASLLNRLKQFEELLADDVIDLKKLRKLCFNGNIKTILKNMV